MWLGRWVCVAALGVCACSGSDDSAASVVGATSCAPFESVTSNVSIAVSAVLGAGRSADGTLYVLTNTASVLALYVTRNDELIERPETGTGEVHDSGVTTYLFDYVGEAGEPVSVQLRQDDAGSRMGVLHGEKPDKTWDIDTEGEELTLVDPASALELPAFSTRTYSLDYEGVQGNGDAFVVVAPDHATSYDDFRLFWGAPERLSERKIQSFIRAKSVGGPTNVTFAVDTGSAVLRYAFPFPPAADASSTGALTIGNTSEALTGSVPPALPDGAQFFCR